MSSERRDTVERKLKYLNDKVIKKILSKETKEMRMFVARIISGVTDIPVEELDHLEMLHPEVGVDSSLINSTLDVVYKEDNLYFSIKVNYGKSKTWKKKNLSYMYQLSLRDLKNYKKYQSSSQIIQIDINSFDSVGKGDFLYKVGLCYEKYQELYSDAFTIYEINLEYYKKLGYNDIEDMKKDSLLKNLAFLVVEDEAFLNELYKGDKVMEELQRECKDVMDRLDELLYYDEEKLQQVIEEEMREEGLKQGLEQGLQQGLERGLEQGEKKKQLEITKKLIKLGMSKDDIIFSTGLSLKELEEINRDIDI